LRQRFARPDDRLFELRLGYPSAHQIRKSGARKEKR
jgi:hypothetical protein